MRDNDVLSVLVERREAIKDWLDKQAPYADLEQKHLDDATTERAYWHHGYQTACADILLLICDDSPAVRN